MIKLKIMKIIRLKKVDLKFHLKKKPQMNKVMLFLKICHLESMLYRLKEMIFINQKKSI